MPDTTYCLISLSQQIKAKYYYISNSTDAKTKASPTKSTSSGVEI